MLIDRHYTGKLNYVTCPITGEIIRFSHVDVNSSPYIFHYVVENSDVTYIASTFIEDANTVYKSSDNKYFLLRKNELMRSVLTSSGFIEKPNLFKFIKYHIVPSFFNFFKKKEENLDSNFKVIPLINKKVNFDYFDYPVVSSINRGDNLVLTKSDEKIEIIVKKISESLIISMSGNIYDLYEWKWARKLNT